MVVVRSGHVGIKWLGEVETSPKEDYSEPRPSYCNPAAPLSCPSSTYSLSKL